MGALTEGAANALLWLFLVADPRTLEGLAWVAAGMATCIAGMAATAVTFFVFDR